MMRREGMAMFKLSVVAPVAFSELMPTTRFLYRSGPPEFPGWIVAVCATYRLDAPMLTRFNPSTCPTVCV